MESNNTNFIGYTLHNDYLSTVHRFLKFNCLEYIDMQTCVEYELPHGVDDNPHVTLWYGDGLSKSQRWFFWFMRIHNQELFTSINSINLENCKIDLFKNENYDVLKINLDNCLEYKTLEQLHRIIESQSTIPTKYGDYHPHITLTYLKKGTGEEVVNLLEENLKLNELLTFNITGFEIGTVGGNTERYNLIQS